MSKPKVPKPSEISFELDKEIFKTGDCVKINMWKEETSFGRIKEIYEKKYSKFKTVLISWFYKPIEIFKTHPEFISEFELIDSNHEQELSIETINEKIKILSIEEYDLGKEYEEEIFFTRSFFDINKNTISPVLSEWERVCICETIKNPDLLYVTCDKCSKYFHVKCVKYSETMKFWYCPRCI